MFKKILAATALLFAVASFAAVDVNKGTAADLDGIKGVKEKKAAKLSADGLTVNGQAFGGAAAAAAAPAKPAKAPAKQ